MNALAADQAKRIAKLIYGSDELRGNVTVGMYVVGGQEQTPARMMSEHGVITDHETMLNKAPDILMTNYKIRWLSVLCWYIRDYRFRGKQQQHSELRRKNLRRALRQGRDHYRRPSERSGVF